MLTAGDIGAEKARSLKIVEIGQDLRVGVVHRHEHRFDFTLGLIRPAAEAAMEILQCIPGVWIEVGRSRAAADLAVGVVSETQDELAKVFLDGVLAGEPLQVIGLHPERRLEREFALAKKNSFSDPSERGGDKADGSGPEREDSGVAPDSSSVHCVPMTPLDSKPSPSPCGLS